MKDTIIDISGDFSFSYGKNLLFGMREGQNNITLDKGCIYGIYGGNGCGKTTFLNILNTFLKPATGKITFSFSTLNYIHGNNSINSSELIGNNIRRCFQTPLLVDELNTYDNISISKRFPKKESFFSTFMLGANEKKDSEIMQLLNLAHFTGDENTATLSYGQRRIIANLQVLYSDAQLTILDEPFANIHQNVIEKLKHEYRKKVARNNSVVVIVEHNKSNLQNFADAVLTIENKQLSLLN
jgi:ABC-type branched-subunit amino acid transport system ATPase component